jgi:hypothetical protein
VFCVSDDLSDNICPVVSKSSDGDFRVGQDMSDRTLSPEDLPMDAPFQEVMGESLQKVEITLENHHDTAGPSGVCCISLYAQSLVQFFRVFLCVNNF